MKHQGMLGTALILATGLSAMAADPTQQDMLEEIRALKSRVAQLEAEQHKPDPAVQKATADAVMADAEKRSALGGGDISIAYTTGKLLIQSADKNFSLHPWIQFQFRSVTNFREDGKDGGTDDDFQNGFEVRRLKFGADGNLFTPDFTYNFYWATDRHDGQPRLEEAWGKYKFANTPWAIKAGQFKDPLDHEQLASSKYQMAADRSLTANIFANGDAYVQGISAIYEKDQLRAELAFTDGLRSANTNFQDYPNDTSGNSPPADWGAAARVEYKFFGNWKDYEKFSTVGNKEDLLIAGVAADYTEAGDTDAVVHVADITYAKANGLGLYGAYLGRFTRNNSASAINDDTFDWTLRGQISYALNAKWEPFVRYNFIRFDSAGLAAGAENEVHEITGGTNYYFKGQSAKFTLDVTYLPNGCPVNDDGSGILASPGEQIVLRAQFSLLL